MKEVILTHPYLSFLAICWTVMWIGIILKGIGSSNTVNNYFDPKKTIDKKVSNSSSKQSKATPDDVR